MPAPLTAPTPARHPPSKLRIPCQAWLLALLLAWLLALPRAHAGEPTTTPLPRVEVGMHTAPIRRIATDGQGRWAVTASEDKTARLWAVASGKLLGVLRPPQDGGDEGKLYAVAMSPDGRQIAVAGRTAHTWDGTVSIYLYQHDPQQHTLRLARRLSGLPEAINHLAFSADGRWLAAGLWGKNGVRVFDAASGQLTGQDASYGADCYSVAFRPASGSQPLELLTSSFDGLLRLHPVDKQGHLGAPRVQRAPGGGQRPFAARFSPDGQRIAVGFADSTVVQVLDARDLRELFRPERQGVDNGNLSKVAWSVDGRSLVAAGRWDVKGQSPMRRWAAQDGRRLADTPLAADTVMDLAPLPQGGWLFAAADPAWGVLDAQGVVQRRQDAQQADLRGQYDQFQLSADGQQVRFGFAKWGKQPYVFDLSRRQLRPAAAHEPGLHAARTHAETLKVENWKNNTQPRLNGQPIQLEPNEPARSLAIDANGKGFVLGADWRLRGYQHSGEPQWRKPVPGVAWAVNQSQDGRWVVAGYDDGSIRWYRREDGQEVLALFVHRDGKRWVLWTPEGFYAASEGGEDLFGYHRNQGKNQNGEFISARQLRETFYRPELLSQRLSAKGDERMREAVAALGDVRQLLARAGAPALRLRSAANVTTDEDGQYTPEVEVQALGDIRASRPRLVVRIDGVEVRDARWNAPVLTPPQRVILPMLKLSEGEHRVSVELVDGRGVASPAVTARVKVPPSRQRAQGTLHLLAVGVSQYHDSSLNLKFAATDAEAMVAKVRERGGALFGQKVVAKALTNANATVAKIDATLSEMANNAKPHDTFLLYFAGHGVTVGGGVGEYHFLPHELEWRNEKALRNQAVSQSKLREWLSWLPVRSLLLLDTCQAGNVISLAGRAAEVKASLSTMIRNSNRSVIVASSNTSIALEGYKKHGIFTWVVLEALDQADYDNNGIIDIDEIAMHVRTHVPKISQSESKSKYRMVPMQDIVGQPFPVALPLKR